MKSIPIETRSGRRYIVSVQEVREPSHDIVRALIDIDLQTFAEATFSHYMAASLLEHGAVFLLKADDVIIGTCVCVRSFSSSYEAVIVSMGIRPGWRGQGLGQRFVIGVLDRLRSRGVRAVCLLVGSDNPRAIRVYRDVGFEVVDEEVVRDSRTGDAYIKMRATLQHDAPVTAFKG